MIGCLINRFLVPGVPVEGIRIATALLYLTDVSEGGATAFVDAGARISPLRNGASFWYNVLPSGYPDLTTQHAGCPVVTGNKWVANKWFDFTAQTFSRSCDVMKDRRDKEAVLYQCQECEVREED